MRGLSFLTSFIKSARQDNATMMKWLSYNLAKVDSAVRVCLVAPSFAGAPNRVAYDLPLFYDASLVGDTKQISDGGLIKRLQKPTTCKKL